MPLPNVTREEFEEMKARQAETQAMVKDMHDALMVPAPGETHSLVHRMAETTRDIETGKRAGRLILWIAGALAALGISIRFGVDVSGNKP